MNHDLISAKLDEIYGPQSLPIAARVQKLSTAIKRRTGWRVSQSASGFVAVKTLPKSKHYPNGRTAVLDFESEYALCQTFLVTDEYKALAKRNQADPHRAAA